MVFVFISERFFAKIEDIDFYILVAMVVIDAGLFWSFSVLMVLKCSHNLFVSSCRLAWPTLILLQEVHRIAYIKFWL